MLKGSKVVIGLLVIAALAAMLTVACSSATSKGPIVLIEQDWDGQIVTTAVAKILLEEKMGYEVELAFAPADSAAMFAGLESGQFHFACCNWPSFSKTFVDDFVDGRGVVERVGPSGIKGTNGWFIPRYMIEGDSSRGIEATTPNLRTYEDMNQYASVFATPDTHGKGRLIDFTPAWDYRNEERIVELGLDYQVMYTGSETAGFTELDAAYKRGDPILIVMWAPHWSHAKYDLIQIGLPTWTSDCYPDGDKYGCGWPQDDVAKLVWPGIKDEHPKVYEFFQNFTITNADQSTMTMNITESNMDYTEAAKAWIDANETTWSSWIP
jgi:glycine betaine/proline transport system substrate-binding protein